MALLDTDIEFLKGIGPAKAKVLRSELGVSTTRDLLFIYPFRYIDKTKFQTIKDARNDGDIILLKGIILNKEAVQGKNGRVRLSAILKDESSFIELVWFQGVKWVNEFIEVGKTYIVYGRVNVFGGKKSIPHPEVEEFTAQAVLKASFDPVYSSTDKLEKAFIDQKFRRKIIKNILENITASDLPENLSQNILNAFKFPNRQDTIEWVHFPTQEHEKTSAQNRIKFEEFFFLQIQLLASKSGRKQQLKGISFPTIGEKFNTFYTKYLPFELTGAQKRVLKEIRYDLGAGYQMNRLLQGDVGSGKTIVALMTMLIALDNGYQACLMAPTEILATQHFISISELVKDLDIQVEFLSGSVKGKKRKQILEDLESGKTDILIGTHALIEESVSFHNIGLSITDEQHRFGVAQRARLWRKSDQVAPHILVMTATPIPRTLAMTTYGDLDVSIIDELPPGRKEIKTVHKFESHRHEVVAFMHQEIQKGRQIYVVFPLIEESEKLDLQNLQAGYEQLLHYFPMPQFQISVVHGRMKAADKDYEMKRFIEKRTQIMVATTVIEVGVNVPNASVMIVENAERFGLSQLHQLRGRVGRGADQSYCILMSGVKVSHEAKARLKTMVRTNNGFEIAEADLELRGPGELEGTRQSGVSSFRLLNLVQDTQIMNAARKSAQHIIDSDPTLSLPENLPIREHLMANSNAKEDWGRIS